MIHRPLPFRNGYKLGRVNASGGVFSQRSLASSDMIPFSNEDGRRSRLEMASSCVNSRVVNPANFFRWNCSVNVKEAACSGLKMAVKE
jgi:hypothetical protein